MLTGAVLLTIQAIIDSRRIGGQTTDSSTSEKTTKAIAAISAYDGAGNNSAQLSVATATTQAPPVSGSSTFHLTTSLAGTNVLPFTVGLVFKKGDIPNYPVLDISDYQVIVKRRWNDGSVKHAIASGQTSLKQNKAKPIRFSNSTVAPTGSNLTAANIAAANPHAMVQLVGYGNVDLSLLAASAPFRTWISGPEMVECHYRSSVGTDPGLNVWFYVRLYKAG
jgi:hypothetical protein